MTALGALGLVVLLVLLAAAVVWWVSATAEFWRAVLLAGAMVIAAKLSRRRIGA